MELHLHAGALRLLATALHDANCKRPWVTRHSHCHGRLHAEGWESLRRHDDAGQEEVSTAQHLPQRQLVGGE